MRYLSALAISSVAVGILIAGCGGGDDSVDTRPIDKATFANRADLICKQASGRMLAKLTAISQEKSASDFAESQTLNAKQAMIPGFEEELRELRGLRIPPQAQGEVMALFGAYEKVIGRARQNPGGFMRSTTSYEPAEIASVRLGISECPIAVVQTG